MALNRNKSDKKYCSVSSESFYIKLNYNRIRSTSIKFFLYLKFYSDGGETQADFSDVFPDVDCEEEKSGDFYNTPASPITVPYCPRPPSTGNFDNYIVMNCLFFVVPHIHMLILVSE